MNEWLDLCYGFGCLFKYLGAGDLISSRTILSVNGILEAKGRGRWLDN